MAFLPKIQVDPTHYDDYITFTVYDITGNYNGVTNPTGWDDNTTVWRRQTDGSPYVVSATLVLKINGTGPAGTFVNQPFAVSPINILNQIQNPNTLDPSGSSIIYDEMFQLPCSGNYVYTIELIIVDSDGTTYTSLEAFQGYCGGLTGAPNISVYNFIPQINLLVDSCNKITIYDTTPWLYYNGAIAKNSFYSIFYITQASLEIKFNGTPIGPPIDVLSTIQNSGTLNNYVLYDYIPNPLVNGLYEVTLTLVDNWSVDSLIPNPQTTIALQSVNVNCSPPIPPTNNFVLNIDANIDNCEGLVIKDITGTYNATTNPDGWNDSTTLYKNSGLGSPYVVEATLSISKLGSEIFGLPTDVTSIVQNSVAEEYVLLSTKSFSNYKFTDGIYIITLTITDNDDNVYQAQLTKVVYCKAYCCVSQLASKLAYELCEDCTSEDFETFDVASTFLNSLDSLALCNQPEFYKMLNKINKLCNLSSTGGCDCDCTYEIKQKTLYI